MKEDFKTLVEKYMQCDKRTLAEMLALRDLDGTAPITEPEPKPQPFIMPDNWDFPWKITDPVRNPFEITDPVTNAFEITDPQPWKISYSTFSTSNILS